MWFQEPAVVGVRQPAALGGEGEPPRPIEEAFSPPTFQPPTPYCRTAFPPTVASALRHRHCAFIKRKRFAYKPSSDKRATHISLVDENCMQFQLHKDFDTVTYRARGAYYYPHVRVILRAAAFCGKAYVHIPKLKC